MLPTSAATLTYDARHHELYVLSEGLVRVVNPVGMEVFTWEQDSALGNVSGVAPLDDGDVIALRQVGTQTELVRCNFRGEILGPFEVDGLREEIAQGFDPVRMLNGGDGRLYLADLYAAKRVLTVDIAVGRVVRSLDLASKLGLEGLQTQYDIDGFAVDGHGNVLVTVAAMFKVFVIAPDGSTRSFGKSGSAPGKFGIVKGVAADDAGNIFVTDILKSAVLVFDADFNFVAEFGYRGTRPGSLLSPRDIVVADGKLFVSQQARRGVAVFSVSHDG
jgi:DNA-binding beta-propeller fold protein YncE